MYSMLNERNIYRYDVGYYGLLTAVHYDVTEYEVGSRFDRSPLTYLTIGIANKIRRAETLEKLMETPLMKKWSHLKFELNKPMLFLWFMYRIFYCVGFYLVDLGATKHTKDAAPSQSWHRGNQTHLIEGHCGMSYQSYSVILTMILVTQAMLSILFDICNLSLRIIGVCRSRLQFYVFWQHHGNFTFIRICQLMSSICILLRYFRTEQFEGRYLESIVVVFGTCLNIWVMLFFGQLMPVIGAFAAVIQAMVMVGGYSTCLTLQYLHVCL